MVPAVGIAQEASTFATERLPVRGRRHRARVVRQPVGLRHHRSVARRRGRRRGIPRGVCSCARCSVARRGRRWRSSPTPIRWARSEPRRPPPHSAKWASRSRLRSRCRPHRSTPPPPRGRSSPASCRRRPRSCCSRPAPTPLAIAQQLAALGYTGTVGVGDSPLRAVHAGDRRRPHRARTHRADRSEHAGDSAA